MFSAFEWMMALRYLRARRQEGFISVIAWFSLLGIMLGVATLIIVMSVMNGFGAELKSRVLGMGDHASLHGYQSPLSDWPMLAAVAEKHPGVTAVAPIVDAQGMLTRSGAVRGALVRGVLPEREAAMGKLDDDYMQVGSLDSLRAGDYKILLGSGLASRLNAKLGSKVTVVAPKARMSPAGVIPRLRRFTVGGIFEVKHNQYDTTLALVHLEDAARLFGLKQGQVSGLRLRVAEVDRAPFIIREIAQGLGGIYSVRDWTMQHKNLLQALQIEKKVMFIILTLIVAVAAFNIVSTLIMVVTDKQADIAILRTLGMTQGTVMRIFVVQGVIIGLVGNVVGALGGVTLASNVEPIVKFVEQTFGITFMPPSVYIISQVPSQVLWSDVMLVTGTTFVLTVLATLYPAWRASRTHPAEALRYE